MTNRIHPLVEEWYPHQRANEAGLNAIEHRLGTTLPSSYRQFMLENGSGEAVVREGNVILYAASQLLSIHSEPKSQFPHHQLMLFGTNGGGEAFAFDLRTRPPGMVMVQFVSDYEKDRILLGSEIADLFDYASKF